MQGFIIPVLDQTQLEKIMTLLGIDQPQWQRTLAIQIFWRTLFAGGIFTAIAAIVVALDEHISPLWIALPIPVVALWCWKYWHSTFYSLTENGFAIRRGLLGFSIAYVPQIKVQKLQIAQSFFGRFNRCGSLVIWSGATRESIGYVEEVQLRASHASILQRVATYRGRWM